MTPIFPKSISDAQYIYRTSDIYIRRPIYNTRLWLVQGLGLGLGQGYRTSDIDIGCRIYILTSDKYIGPICILDVRYRFRKHWWHFVLNGTSFLHMYMLQQGTTYWWDVLHSFIVLFLDLLKLLYKSTVNFCRLPKMGDIISN